MRETRRSGSTGEVNLQVLICTFGEEGIRRVAACHHPSVDGVSYIVSWQCPGIKPLIPDELKRDDFKIVTSETLGLSKNRNIAIDAATAPIALISDDDVRYTRERLAAVIDAFDNHPDDDILTFRYESAEEKKYYPEHECPLFRRPKGYYPSSIEIAFRRASVQGRFRFNENFGLGAKYPSGEEDIFLMDLRKGALKGTFVPLTIAEHPGASTGTRKRGIPDFVRTKGAVMRRIKPYTWWLRMLTHALRPAERGSLSIPSYIRLWLRGACADL